VSLGLDSFGRRLVDPLPLLVLLSGPVPPMSRLLVPLISMVMDHANSANAMEPDEVERT